ncbi:MAG: hypothetical protein U5J82_07580 [Desulfobacterales bacterium]|nr:hypothetical protein [Desulfobacterales bacterium]
MSADSFQSTFKTVFSGRMLVAFMMGLASGLPLLLTISVLQAWMKDEGVDLAVIGLMALVGLPYTLKFLWAPILDRFSLPRLGRRRGWLLVFQAALIVAIAGLGLTDPRRNPAGVALVAFLVTFLSASQDIVAIDALRRGRPGRASELGLGSSLYINGYRVGMLVASGGGLILAEYIPFSLVYAIMAACLLPGVVTTVLAPEPRAAAGAPRSLREAVVAPLSEYFRRPEAVWILAFILLYKIGDTMASAM